MKWEDMSRGEKILFVISVIGAVLVVVDHVKPGLFPVNLTYPGVAIFTVCEGMVYWNKQRKWAYLLIAGAAISMVFFALELFLMA